eukprot:scaffold13923_cov26-Tisochrysis_lutea.AAC.2
MMVVSSSMALIFLILSSARGSCFSPNSPSSAGSLGNNAQQLRLVRVRGRAQGRLGRHRSLVGFETVGRWHLGLSLRKALEMVRADGMQTVLTQEIGGVGPELVRILDEGPAIHVAHIRLAAGAQQIEAAQCLPEGKNHFARDLLLVVRQDERVAELFATRVAHNLAVNHGGLARLAMCILWPNSVDLNVRTLRLEEFFVNVAPAVASARVVLIRIELT